MCIIFLSWFEISKISKFSKSGDPKFQISKISNLENESEIFLRSRFFFRDQKKIWSRKYFFEIEKILGRKNIFSRSKKKSGRKNIFSRSKKKLDRKKYFFEIGKF